MSVAQSKTATDSNHPRVIEPTGVYSPRQLADIFATGTQPFYKAIKLGTLRAARLNDRGDFRVLGQWVLDFLARRAEEGPAK